MIRMPNFHSITVPGEYQDNPVFKWENGVEIPAEEYICQVSIIVQLKKIINRVQSTKKYRVSVAVAR